jgi:hypothetical protein
MSERRGLKLKAEHLARLEGALLRGDPAAAVVKRYAEDSGIGERQGWRDLELLKRQWGERAAAALGSATEVGRAVARREVLFAAALAAGDLVTALAADRDRCELLKLYGAESGRATGSSDSPGGAMDK